MSSIKATVKDGRLELRVPPDWPDGTEVEIQPVRQASANDDGPMTAEETARILSAMQRVEPFDLTAEAAADLDAWERRVNAYTIANQDQGLEDVFR